MLITTPIYTCSDTHEEKKSRSDVMILLKFALDAETPSEKEEATLG